MRILCTIIVGLMLANQPANASITTYFDKGQFLSVTGATSATGPLPSLPPTISPVIVGDVTFTTLSGAMFFGFSGVDWTPLLPGNDLAISGEEKLAIQLANPVTAFGFDFVEPTAANPNIFAPFVDSTFDVTLRISGAATTVGSFSFNAPNDVAAFIGVTADTAFDDITILETVGGIENEFFGQVFTNNPANQKVPEPAALGILAIGLAFLLANNRQKARIRPTNRASWLHPACWGLWKTKNRVLA